MLSHSPDWQLLPCGMYWNPPPSQKDGIFFEGISGDPNGVPLERILTPFDLDTRIHLPDSHSTTSHSTTSHHSPDNSPQQSTPSYCAPASTNTNVPDPNMLTPDPQGIYEFLAEWGYAAMGSTPGVPGISSLETPLAFVDMRASDEPQVEEPYMLSTYMTVRTSDDPLVHEARLAIRARRILEGQNMLRTRQEEGWQWQRALSSNSSMDTLMTQGNPTNCTEGGLPEVEHC